MRRKAKIIYIVDDSMYNLKAIDRKVKRALRCETRLFQDPNEALKAMEHQTPDLVLTDYRLDHHLHNALSGEQLLLAVKKMHPDVPVVVYSASKSELLALRLIARGAEEFIPRSSAFYQEIGPISAFHINRLRLPLQGAKVAIFSTLLLTLVFFVLISTGMIAFASFSIIGSIILLGVSVFVIEMITRKYRNQHA